MQRAITATGRRGVPGVFEGKWGEEVKVAIYARVSTDEQTTDNQLPPLEQWIKERGHTLVATYTENITAWKAGHQGQLARLFKELPQTQAEICLVWHLDRLTREGASRMFEILTKFSSYNVQVISYQQLFITDTPPMFRGMMTAFFAEMAKMESSTKSQRVKAGLERRRAAGLPIGRQKGSKDKSKRRNVGYILYHNPDLKGKYVNGV